MPSRAESSSRTGERSHDLPDAREGALSRFTTSREAKPSCLAPRNIGNGISGHTSRRRTHQNPHAGSPQRNRGRSEESARVGRATELRFATRHSSLPTTNIRAPRTSFASDLNGSRGLDGYAETAK